MCILKFLEIFFSYELYNTNSRDIKTESDIDIQQILDNQYDEPPSYTETVQNSIILEKI
jgi:hypothetical protein|tara:strand:+ start:1029 stop:1205 length:177 start_codon:yes stop_codon:yes gene_type:complete